MKALPIGPEEAFILSRVDGRTSVEEIALCTGFDEEKVRGVLAALSRMGAIAGIDGSSAQPRDSTPSPSSPPTDRSIDASRVHYDPRELDEPGDLSAERKHEILEMYHQLETLDHYELLRVAREADKAAIKAAYFTLVNVFHPDRYFGKALGAFEAKLSRVFQKITQAHETLSKKKSRADYDAYLASKAATRDFERLQEDTSHAAEVEAVRRDIQREVMLQEQDAKPHYGRAPSEPPIQARIVTPEERRRALARKIRGSIPPNRPPPPSDKEAQKAAANELRRVYEERVARVMSERVLRYVEQADEAERGGNVVAAATALRIAQSLTPNDPELTERLERADSQASAALHKRYLEQAQYEERQGNFLNAARNYDRALQGKPDDPALAERAAHCLLEAGAELRKAGNLARRAVELAPKETAYRITLARVYERAGMTQSALAELERAKTLDPGNDSIKDSLKRLKRGQG